MSGGAESEAGEAEPLRRSRSRNSDLFSRADLSFNSPLVSSRSPRASASLTATPSRSPHASRKPEAAAQQQPRRPEVDTPPTRPRSPALPEDVLEAVTVPDPLPPPSFGQPFQLRLSATRTYMLGLGEFSTVYLAAWKPQSSVLDKPKAPEREDRWSLCAVKRINPDRDSQKAAFNEAYVLARLGSQRAFTNGQGQSDEAPSSNGGDVALRGCKDIVRILGVKDEHHEDVQLLDTEPSTRASAYALRRHRVSTPGGVAAAAASGSPTPASRARHVPRNSIPGPVLQAGSSSGAVAAEPSGTAAAAADSPATSQISIEGYSVPRLQLPKNRTLRHVQLAVDTSDDENNHGAESDTPASPSRASLNVPSLSASVGPSGSASRSRNRHVTAVGATPPASEGSVRRAISLRDPSAHSGNKPTGSDEAEAAARRDAHDQQRTQTQGDAPRLLLVYELCPNGTLASFIRRKGSQIGKSLWFKWAKQIVSAVSHCHRFRIMHGDVKTQNLMLTADMDSRLSDFGSSLPINPDNPPTEGLGLGTVAYNAPELVAKPGKPFGLEADVFSVGIVLHVMITGREPYASCRTTVEQMLHVGRGGYWSWAAREIWEHQANLANNGLNISQATWGSRSRPQSLHSMAGSDDSSFAPPPSGPYAVPSPSRSANTSYHQRQSSSGSSRRGLGMSDVDRLLAEDPTQVAPPLSSSSSSYARHLPPSSAMSNNEFQLPVSSLASDDEEDSGPEQSPSFPSTSGPGSPWFSNSSQNRSRSPSRTRRSSLLQTYKDGTPVQYFLDGRDVVPEEILRLLEQMVSSKPEDRPHMTQVGSTLSKLEQSSL